MDEFKQDAVDLVLREKYSVRGAARSLGIPPKTLDNWVSKYRSANVEVAQMAEQNELERENRRLPRTAG